MYRIGEFSKIVNLPIKTLRYYDEIKILTPSQIDKFTGYRYYDDNNVIECEIIKLLKSVNFSLDEIRIYKDNLTEDILISKQKEILEKIYNSKRNLIINGDMSTGKTQNISYPIVDKIIDKNESLLILDSKKEYINRYYNKLKENNYNIMILNLKDLDKSHNWNPLEYPYKLYKQNKHDEALKYVEKISKEIFFDDVEKVDLFWNNSASDLFIGLLFALFEDGTEENINFCSINSMLNMELEVDYIAEYFRTKDKNSTSYICASGSVFSPIETRGGIVSTAKQKLRPLVSKDKINILLNKNTFNPDNISKEKTAIFLLIDEEEKNLSPLITIFINQIYNILRKENNNKFNFILDNFDTINNIDNFIEILSSCISKNIKFTIITRDKKKCKKQYGEYINKISNNIEVTEKNIKISINDEVYTYDNNIVDIIINSNVEYPNTTVYKIEIFDLKKFLLTNFNKNKE